MIRRHFLPLLAVLVAAACVVYPLHALAHLGGEQFFSGPDAPSPDAPQVTLSGLPTHAFDFDNDGRGDLVWRNTATGTTAMWLMRGTTTVASTTINADGNWSAVDIVDGNGDNRHDLVWRHAITGESAVL